MEAARQGRLSWSSWTAFYVSLWAFFLGAALFSIFFSGLLRIDHKDIAPAKTVSKNDIGAVIDEFLGGTWLGAVPKNTLPVAFLRRGILERALRERFPVFRNATVSFVFPQTILVSFEERETTILLCSGGPCFLIDERGFAFDGSPMPLPTWGMDDPLVVIDCSAKPVSFQDPIFSEEYLRIFSSFRKELFDELGIVTSRTGETPSRLSDELWLETQEGWELRLSADVPAEKSFLALRLLFAKTLLESDRRRLEYVDLRTKNRIFYLLKGGEEKEGEKQ